MCVLAHPNTDSRQMRMLAHASASHSRAHISHTQIPLPAQAEIHTNPCEYGCASAAPYFLEPFAARARAAYGACT
eukprot:6051145-Alexandrium_andersonii.AAC.1